MTAPRVPPPAALLALPAPVIAGLLPAPRYSVILADPPWKYENESCQGTAANHYPTMTMPDLKKLPVKDQSDKNCVLLMWATWPMLSKALELGAAWGFTYKTCAFVWSKLNPGSAHRWTVADDPVNWVCGIGFWTRGSTEFCLLFTKGEPHRKATDVRQLIVAERRQHSRKPDEQYDRIERLLDGPYLELFARRKHPGWHSWGNEVECDIQMPVASFAALGAGG